MKAFWQKIISKSAVSLNALKGFGAQKHAFSERDVWPALAFTHQEK